MENFLPKTLPNVAELIDGFDTDTVNSIFAIPKTGKTLLCEQAGVDMATQMGKNVLLIDTEGGANRFAEIWLPIFHKRIGSTKCKIHVVTKRSIEALLSFHGTDVAKKISEVKEQRDGTVKGGKIELALRGYADKPPILDFVKEHNIGVVIYDSLTEPLRTFGNRQENYPARADATGYLFDGIFNLMDTEELLVFATHHQTLNPANPYDVPDMRGGNVVHHMSKCVLYLDGWEKKTMRDYRKLSLVRYYNKPSWRDTVFFKINDEGYHSVKEKEVMDAYKG